MFDRLVNIWEKIAKFTLSLSFRMILFVALLLFCAMPNQLLISTGIDHAMLSLLSRIHGAQVGPAEIGIVTIPNEIAEQWDADFYNTDELSSLLSNIIHSSDASIGLLLDEPLNSYPTMVDNQLATDESDNYAQHILQKKRYLNELLSDPRVVLGALTNKHDVLPLLSIRGVDTIERGLTKFRAWYLGCEWCNDSASFDFDGEWYYGPASGSIFDAVWLPVENGYAPTFLSALVLNTQAQQVLNGAPVLAIRPSPLTSSVSGGDDLNIPLGPFFTAHASQSDLAPKIIRLALADALLVGAFPRFVMIASEKNATLVNDKASVLYSLIHQNTVSVPWWGEPTGRVFVLLFFFYLVCMHFRIRSLQGRLIALALWFTGLFSIVSLVSIRFNLWLPFSSVLILCCIVFLVFSLWRFSFNQKAKKQKELAQIIDRAGYLLEGGNYLSEAMGLFAHHPTTRLAVEKMCHIANRMQEENIPVRQVITLVDSLLPLVGNDSRLADKVVSLKQTLADGNHLTVTQSREPTPSDDMPDTLGRYQIQREIGRGAVGIVYLGFDPAISRSVAIKTLDARQFSKDQHESLQTRFFREAEAAGRLNHPNIVSVFDVGEEGDLAFIAMDYVEGVALSDHVQKNTLLPVSVVFRIIHDVAVALSYAHENQIIHRDIKPGNIMYSADPYTLKVADFGIARLLDNSKTSTGEILGSPLYMAPEQLRGSKVGATADVFSLGVTFYQLLSGELPFNADNLASLTYEIIHTKHKGVRAARKDLPASAARIVNQCLQKKADDRYESANELAGVIRKAIRRDFPAEAKRWAMY